MTSIPIGVECLINQLQEHILPTTERMPEFYSWQSLSLGAFYSGMEDARRLLGPGRHKFIDVGSGIGTKLYLADSLGFSPYGIELHPSYIEVSKTLFPEYPVDCIDAREFEDYEYFDVIYSYRLYRDDRMQASLSKWLAHRARPGAALILAGADPMAGSFEEITETANA